MGKPVSDMLLDALADGVCRSRDYLQGATGLSKRQVNGGAGYLIRVGYLLQGDNGHLTVTQKGCDALRAEVKIVRGGHGNQNHHKYSRTCIRAKLWRAIIICSGRKFTLGDLLRRATAGNNPVNPSNPRKYITALVRAEYLLEFPSRMTEQGGKTERSYVLVRNTGDKHPVLRGRGRGQSVFDQNTKVFYGVSAGRIQGGLDNITQDGGE